MRSESVDCEPLSERRAEMLELRAVAAARVEPHTVIGRPPLLTFAQCLERAGQRLDAVYTARIDANIVRMIEAGVDEAAVRDHVEDAWEVYVPCCAEVLKQLRAFTARRLARRDGRVSRRSLTTE